MISDLLSDKMLSADAAIGMVNNGDRIVFPVGREPPTLASALAARRQELKDITISVCWAYGDYGFYEPGWEDSFKVEVGLLSLPRARQMAKEKRCDIELSSISLTPELEQPIDFLLLEVSPPDKNGFCSFGSVVGSKPAQVKAARVVIAEINSRLIHTYGQNFVHISDIDYLVEHIPSKKPPSKTDITGRALDEPSQESRRIAEFVSSLIKDGDTIQIGVGKASEGVLRCGVLDSKSDLGWHSEATPEEVIDLVRLGVFNGKHKTVHQGKTIATGITTRTPAAADFVDRNPLFELYPIEYTDDPKLIAAHDNMVAINNALAVDLTGQVTAESIGIDLYSIAGGQPAFALGAILSLGGKSITALFSTAQAGDKIVSSIMSILPAGTAVTVPRTIVDYVVTEHGIAQLRGKTLKHRVLEMIAIAHPDFRAELRRKAEKLYGKI